MIGITFGFFWGEKNVILQSIRNSTEWTAQA